jgi:hypothetical protein
MNHLDRMMKRMEKRHLARLARADEIIRKAEARERRLLGVVRPVKVSDTQKLFMLENRIECANRLGIPLNPYLRRII